MNQSDNDRKSNQRRLNLKEVIFDDRNIPFFQKKEGECSNDILVFIIIFILTY
jgi:hypothetical protein